MNKVNTLVKRKSKKGSDMFETPDYGIEPLLPYIKKEWIIWDGSCGKNKRIAKFFDRNGYNVIATDIEIENEEECIDYLEENNLKFDCIVMNPPFSIKNAFIKKTYEYRKPFALLMPLTALSTKERQYYYLTYGLQILEPNCRIDFEKEGLKKSSAWFDTCWFTLGLGLPIHASITFCEINKGKENKLELFDNIN